MDQTILFDEFKRLQLVIARIIDIWEHPNADKLYVLKIDIGGQEKQLVAGIRGSYTKEELKDRQIVVVNNLTTAMIRGEKSEGMLLAVSDEKGISLIGPDRVVQLGSPVR